MNGLPLRVSAPGAFAATALGIIAAFPAFAQQTPQSVQTEAAIQESRRFAVDPNLRADKSQRVAEYADDTMAPASPGDDDIGRQVILRRQERQQPFTAFGDFSGHWSQNIALTADSEQGDWMLVGQVGASYAPRLSSQWLMDVTVRHQWFRYQDFTELDFDSLDAGIGFTHVMDYFHDVAWTLRYNYSRLTDEEEGNEFSKTHSITTGFNKVFPFSRAHFLMAGFSATMSMQDPAAAQRDDFSLYANYVANLTRALEASLYYRISYIVYDFGGREDLGNNVSLGLRYKITEWCDVNSTGSLSFNNSEEPIFDYASYSVGGTVGLRYRF